MGLMLPEQIDEERRTGHYTQTLIDEQGLYEEIVLTGRSSSEPEEAPAPAPKKSRSHDKHAKHPPHAARAAAELGEQWVHIPQPKGDYF